jgi:23S rRNA (adenine2503-C2)-methyltransferase
MIGEKLTNVVMMGMGEPLANYSNVMNALHLMNDPTALAMGARRFTISTSGVVPGIQKIATETMQVNLAVSLHAPNNALRDRLVPINRTYPLEKLLPAIDEYISSTGRRVTFEYVLLHDVNDAPAHAEELSHLLRQRLCHVNLIPVNPVEETGFERPADENTSLFARILERNGVEVTVRKEKGAGIDAACGQLRARQKR